MYRIIIQMCALHLQLYIMVSVDFFMVTIFRDAKITLMEIDCMQLLNNEIFT